ncbi:MAG TPA: hypothetical protein VG796_04190 [Verrucomicrobiales bacterium]|nr:hypothetical protein [Verrucomicrobiales bacterium]
MAQESSLGKAGEGQPIDRPESVPLLVPKWSVSMPKALEHADVEVAQGRRVLGIEVEVLAVLEAAAGEEDGEIFGGVAAGVAGVAAWGWCIGFSRSPSPPRSGTTL